jgi:putative superfamily III holin-X
MATSDAHARRLDPAQGATKDRSTLKVVHEIVGERANVARSVTVAGVLSLLAVIFAGHSIAIALGAKLPDWVGWAVVAGALLLGAGVLVMVARAVHHPPPSATERFSIDRG